MKLIVDSREKKWEHIRSYFDKNGIEYCVRKLDVGDYQLDDRPSRSVDRKKNLSEISHNLMNASDRARFLKEARRARMQGVKLYILCEHGGKIKSIQDVVKWRDKYSGVRGSVLAKEIHRVSVSYDVTFIFCSKRQTARKIIEILQENT